MQITESIMQRSVKQQSFGSVEPFMSGDDCAVNAFYGQVLSALEKVPGVCVLRELDHHGSGYASYVSALLYPSDGRSRHDFGPYVEIKGVLLYMSRLAPIGVFGASSRTDNKDGRGSSSGFIGIDNVGILPDDNWAVFIATVEQSLQAFGIKFLPREPLLTAAPENIEIPTVFDGPYYVFDTLFYWSD